MNKPENLRDYLTRDFASNGHVFKSTLDFTVFPGSNMYLVLKRDFERIAGCDYVLVQPLDSLKREQGDPRLVCAREHLDDKLV